MTFTFEGIQTSEKEDFTFEGIQEAPTAKGPESFLRKPGAFVKGAAKGVASVPRILQTLPLSLANLLTPEDAPWKEALEKKLQSIEKTPLEETISKRLESKFETAPEEEKFEKGGVRFGESIGMGIDPIASLLGSGAAQIAEEMGGGPGTQTIAELLGFSVPSITKGITKGITKEAVKAPSGLTEIKGVKGKSKILKPKAFPSQIEKRMLSIQNESKNLIKQIEQESIPVAKSVSQGRPVEYINNKLLDKTEEASKLIKQKIPTGRVVEFLKEEKAKIQKAPIPADIETKALKKINTFLNTFEVAKEFTPNQYLRQFRSINKDLKEIFSAKLIKGTQEPVTKLLSGINKNIAESIQKDLIGNDVFKNMFRTSNEVFSQIKKFDKFQEVIGKSLTNEGMININKFDQLFKNTKTSKQIRNSLGVEGFNKLEQLNTDLQKFQKSIGKIDVEGIKGLLTKVGFSAVLNLLPLPTKAITGVFASKKALQFYLGSLALRPKKLNNYRQLLQSIRIGKKAAIVSAAKKVNKDLEEQGLIKD